MNVTLEYSYPGWNQGETLASCSLYPSPGPDPWEAERGGTFLAWKNKYDSQRLKRTKKQVTHLTAP